MWSQEETTMSNFLESAQQKVEKLEFLPIEKELIMDLLKIKNLVQEKFIRVQKHLTEELYIYNYSAKAQYERMWTEETLACRGLILDNLGNVVARPFPKFFNLGELEEQDIPNLPFEVFEKMDGSLGISYSIDGAFFVATRGSFVSEQAEFATQMLRTKYQEATQQMNEDYTYLFEIIYPENRIVVDYGEREELVLLAVIDRQTGEEYPLDDIGFPVVKSYDGISSIAELNALDEDDREGFVVKFANNFRLKVKFQEYLRLHRIITQVNSYNIWEYLKSGQSMDEILEKVPDEFYDWVKGVREELETAYDKIEKEAMAA